MSMLILALAACTEPVSLPTVTPSATDVPAPTPTREISVDGSWNVGCLSPEQQTMVVNTNPCLSIPAVKHEGDFVYLQPAQMSVVLHPNANGEVGINMVYRAGYAYLLGISAPGKFWSGSVQTLTRPIALTEDVCYLALVYSYADIWPGVTTTTNLQLAFNYGLSLSLYLDSDERIVEFPEQGLYRIIPRFGENDFYDMTGQRENLWAFWTDKYDVTVLPALLFTSRFGLASPESTWTLQVFAILETADEGGQGYCNRIEAF